MTLHSLKNYFSLITISLFLFTCQKQTQHLRQTLDLSGHWQFSIDSADVGIQQKWYLADPEDVIELPGTTDLRRKGFLNQDTSASHLNRIYRYEGPAWYRKKITIPPEF
ncbi:MAG: beta-glycosidase, partial [Candidatus Lokiarchaeota archaeon]|nr:beta-glycosidase [Candidatus Lokiarchaeota archaeon]